MHYRSNLSLHKPCAQTLIVMHFFSATCRSTLHRVVAVGKERYSVSILTTEFSFFVKGFHFPSLFTIYLLKKSGVSFFMGKPPPVT